MQLPINATPPTSIGHKLPPTPRVSSERETGPGQQTDRTAPGLIYFLSHQNEVSIFGLLEKDLKM